MSEQAQAERKAQAKAWLDENLAAYQYDQSNVESLATLLAATEQAVWEEAAQCIIDEHRMGDRDAWIDLANELRQQANEVGNE